METMPISKFKATCLAVLQRVRRTGRPVLVTRFGKPVAEVVAPRAAEAEGGWVGSMVAGPRSRATSSLPWSASREWKALRK